MKKIGFLFLIFLMIVSCHGSKNDFSVRYQYTGLELENAHNLENLPKVTKADSIPIDAYLIRANLFPIIISEGSAYADLDHPPTNINTIDSVIITSDSDFNIDLPSGASLNERFIYFNDSYFHTYKLDEMQITNLWKDDVKENPVPSKIDLMLVEPPTTSMSHIFTVKLFLQDGSVFTDSTPEIKFYQ